MKQFFKKIQLFGCTVYITDKDCRVRKRQKRDVGMQTKKERKDNFLKHKWPIIQNRGGQCEICGSSEHLNIHHILPYSRFPEYQNDERNMLVVCPKCHKGIHDNPFMMCEMIKHKANELDVDYKERYYSKNEKL